MDSMDAIGKELETKRAILGVPFRIKRSGHIT